MNSSKPQYPSFEARHLGDVWDITMRIPHELPGGGDTIESLLTVNESAGFTPSEEETANRVCLALNMTAHIDTVDLSRPGASLQLVTLQSQQVAPNGDSIRVSTVQSDPRAVAPAPELSDAERDLRDTNAALRRGLNVIGKAFGVSSSDPQLIATCVVDTYEKLQEAYGQVDQSRKEHTKTINELRAIFGAAEATPNSLMTLTRNAKENADLLNQATCDRGDALHTLNAIREAMEVDPDHEYAELPAIAAGVHQEREALRLALGAEQAKGVKLSDQLKQREIILQRIGGAIGAPAGTTTAELPTLVEQVVMKLTAAETERDTLREGCKELADKNQHNLQAAEEAGKRLDDAHRALKNIERALDVKTESPGALEGIIIERLNALTSIQSAQNTIQSFTLEVMQLCAIKPSNPKMLPSLPELLHLIRDHVNVLTRYRGGALILHDLTCELTGTASPATDADPYAHAPWRILADRLEENFYAPRNAIRTMAENFDLEAKPEYRDTMADIYHYVKGLTVSQHKHDQQLQTLLAERSADRAIIGAIDDLCGDRLNRPTAPVMAAIQALVAAHIHAIYAKEKSNG